MFKLGQVNESQRKAVLTTEGPVLIIAGPGTGKTFTLVKRIAYLVVEKQVLPESIMVVTFTEKAAKELLTRISNEFVKYDVHININDMYIGTFHSVCLRLLKENSEYTEEAGVGRMIDAFEQAYLVCRNIEEFQYLGGYKEHMPIREGVWKQALEICRYVNQLMEELVDIDAMEQDKDPDMRFLGKLVMRYNALLERKCAMDFSSIQTKTFAMFKNTPEVLDKIKEKVSYIMVDEYQDTNYIQEQLVFMLAGEKRNICVVGDDDQGMYRFRGATIRNILEFPEKFADGECSVIHLDKNYRSEPGIIDFYNSWMSNVDGINLFNWDKYRYDKKIIPGRTDTKATEATEAVYKCGGATVEEEKEALYKLIKQLKDNGNITNYNQLAFLFRSVKGQEATEIGTFLEERGIPVYSPRSDMFFGREEVKLTLGCFMMCFMSYMSDLKNNSFNHRISKELREYYIGCVKEANQLRKSDGALNQFIMAESKRIATLTEITEEGLLDIFYKLMSFEPFKSYLEADLNDIVIKTRGARNLSEISRLIARYNYLHDMHCLTGDNKLAMPEELFNIYFRYLYEEGIGEYEDESEYAPSGCVSFMTIHQSKGLEFPVVVVGSLGNYPRKDSDVLMYTAESRFFNRKPYEPMADIKYFDFWRLYYTAFSRAQNLLVLAYKKQENKYFDQWLMGLPEADTYDEAYEFARVKDVNYKHVYSFTSHISVYDGCPTQYKYYKEYRFAQNKMFHTSVGSLVHATLEDLNNCVIDGHIDRVNEQAIKEWFYLNYETMKEQTGYYLTDEQQKNAMEQVIRYYQNRGKEISKVWRAEEEINLVLPKYILQGIIDLIEGEGDTVEIVDYKTGPKPNIEGHPERVEHYKKQMEIYAYLIEQRYGKKVSRMNLYYTSVIDGNPLITFEYKQEAIDKTVEEIDATVAAIEAKKFDRKVQNIYACEFCDMRYVCGKSCANQEG